MEALMKLVSSRLLTLFGRPVQKWVLEILLLMNWESNRGWGNRENVLAMNGRKRC